MTAHILISFDALLRTQGLQLDIKINTRPIQCVLRLRESKYKWPTTMDRSGRIPVVSGLHYRERIRKWPISEAAAAR